MKWIQNHEKQTKSILIFVFINILLNSRGKINFHNFFWEIIKINSNFSIIFFQVLQCFHTFCQACLEKVQDHPDRVNCPQCHFDTPLGSGGVAGLLSDYGITGLLEITASGSAMAGGIDFGATICTGCKSRDSALAVARCMTCANFLCSNCVMAHKVRCNLFWIMHPTT